MQQIDYYNMLNILPKERVCFIAYCTRNIRDTAQYSLIFLCNTPKVLFKS